MPEISLTTFVDFVLKSGTPKLTVLRNAKKQMDDGYGPEKDFYKIIRQSIIHMHRTNGTFRVVSETMSNLSDGKKLRNYPGIADGYRKWAGRRGKWFEPPRALWQHGQLRVRVNPELGFEIKGTPHLIKLYFKADPLKKNRIDAITHLLELACAEVIPDNCVMGILDVRRSKLITPTVPINGLDTMLRAEASYWVSAWEELD